MCRLRQTPPKMYNHADAIPTVTDSTLIWYLIRISNCAINSLLIHNLHFDKEEFGLNKDFSV